jgi:predicted DNA-binding transcriptional regulator AlpA
MAKTRAGQGIGTGADKSAPRRMRVYRFADLKPAGVPFTRKHVTTLEKRDEFPPHFQLGPNSVAWVGDEVDAWVEGKIRARRVVPIVG